MKNRVIHKPDGFIEIKRHQHYAESNIRFFSWTFKNLAHKKEDRVVEWGEEGDHATDLAEAANSVKEFSDTMKEKEALLQEKLEDFRKASRNHQWDT